MNKKIMTPFFLLFALLLNLNIASAHCPLCTGAVAMTAMGANYYGFDLIIIGLFTGAFAISTGLWLGKKIKTEYFKFQIWTIVLLSFLLTVVPLRMLSGENIYIPLRLFGEVGSMFNKVYWMDRLLFGSILGGILSVFAFGTHVTVKKINNGNVLFPFQGIALTIGILAIASVIVQLVT